MTAESDALMAIILTELLSGSSVFCAGLLVVRILDMAKSMEISSFRYIYS